MIHIKEEKTPGYDLRFRFKMNEFIQSIDIILLLTASFVI